jgi:hypothetical protein
MLMNWLEVAVTRLLHLQRPLEGPKLAEQGVAVLVGAGRGEPRARARLGATELTEGGPGELAEVMMPLEIVWQCLNSLKSDESAESV